MAIVYPIYQVDAFSKQVFGGNPAAVCPLKSWPERALMQHIAAENNLSETAFFVPQEAPGHFSLTWFTPVNEIDLCGHATLAAAHVLWEALQLKEPVVHFHTPKAGVLTVKKIAPSTYLMDFPAMPATPLTDFPDILSDALPKGFTEVLTSRDLVVVYNSAGLVEQMQPDFSLLKQLEQHVIVTAAGEADFDFVSRFFAPSIAIDEDPVTGSAHCTLVPYWANKLSKNKLRAAQVSSRGGVLDCSLENDRVFMAGNAVTYLKGEIYLP